MSEIIAESPINSVLVIDSNKRDKIVNTNPYDFPIQSAVFSYNQNFKKARLTEFSMNWNIKNINNSNNQVYVRVQKSGVPVVPVGGDDILTIDDGNYDVVNFEAVFEPLLDAMFPAAGFTVTADSNENTLAITLNATYTFRFDPIQPIDSYPNSLYTMLNIPITPFASGAYSAVATFGPIEFNPVKYIDVVCDQITGASTNDVLTTRRLLYRYYLPWFTHAQYLEDGGVIQLTIQVQNPKTVKWNKGSPLGNLKVELISSDGRNLGNLWGYYNDSDPNTAAGQQRYLGNFQCTVLLEQ